MLADRPAADPALDPGLHVQRLLLLCESGLGLGLGLGGSLDGSLSGPALRFWGWLLLFWGLWGLLALWLFGYL